MPDQFYFQEPFTFVWDEEKNRSNIKKHGVDFKTAALVFHDDLRLEYPDPDHSEEEARYRTIGLVHDVLTVVCCDRENSITGETTSASSLRVWPRSWSETHTTTISSAGIEQDWRGKNGQGHPICTGT